MDIIICKNSLNKKYLYDCKIKNLGIDFFDKGCVFNNIFDVFNYIKEQLNFYENKVCHNDVSIGVDTLSYNEKVLLHQFIKRELSFLQEYKKEV